MNFRVNDRAFMRTKNELIERVYERIFLLFISTHKKIETQHSNFFYSLAFIKKLKLNILISFIH
jgi:hypothetical protein